MSQERAITGNISLSYGKPFKLCISSWGAAGSCLVGTWNLFALIISIFSLPCDYFKLGALWFFWTSQSLSKSSLGSRSCRPWELFLFRLMSVLPSSLEEFSKPLICTLPGDKSDKWYYFRRSKLEHCFWLRNVLNFLCSSTQRSDSICCVISKGSWGFCFCFVVLFIDKSFCTLSL